MFEKFKVDFLINFIRRIAQSVVFLLAIKYYTNYLTPTEFGNYSIILFFANLAALLSTSWISASYLRFSNYFPNPSDLLNNLLSITILSTLFVGIGFYLFLFYCNNYHFLNLDIENIFLPTIIFISLSLFNFLSTCLIVQNKLKKLGTIIIFQAAISLIISIFLLKLINHKIEMIFISLVLSYLFAILIMILEVFPKLPNLTLNKVLIPEIIKYSLPLLFMSILSLTLISGDQVILKYFKFNLETGIYSANYTLIDKSITIITGIFTLTYTPILFKNWNENKKEEAINFYFKTIKLYAIIIGIIVLIILALYETFGSLILNPNYINTKILVLILGGSIFFNFTNIISEIFTLNKRTDLLAFCFIIPVFINLSSNYYFIPKFGINAAATNTLLSYFILFIITFFTAKYKFFKS